MHLTLETLFAALAITSLFTSIFALKFRYWHRPKLLTLYAILIFFAQFALHSVLPEDAFGPALTYLCFALTVPVVLAIYLIDRHERKHRRTEG